MYPSWGEGTFLRSGAFRASLGWGTSYASWDDVLLGLSDPWVASAAWGVDMAGAWAWDRDLVVVMLVADGVGYFDLFWWVI